MFLFKNDVDRLKSVVFLEKIFIRLCLEFKFILMEQDEDYLDYIKNQDEYILEMTLNRYMEAYFATTFEDVRFERS